MPKIADVVCSLMKLLTEKSYIFLLAVHARSRLVFDRLFRVFLYFLSVIIVDKVPILYSISLLNLDR